MLRRKLLSGVYMQSNPLAREDMKQAATVMAAFVYQTAMMDEKIPRKPMK